MLFTVHLSLIAQKCGCINISLVLINNYFQGKNKMKTLTINEVEQISGGNFLGNLVGLAGGALVGAALSETISEAAIFGLAASFPAALPIAIGITTTGMGALAGLAIMRSLETQSSSTPYGFYYY